MQIVERCGKRKDKIVASKSIFSITTCDRVPGERWGVAEILEALLAIGARAIRPAEPADTDSCAQRNLCRSPVDDLSYDLVAGNKTQLLRGQVSFHDVKV